MKRRLFKISRFQETFKGHAEDEDVFFEGMEVITDVIKVPP